MFVSFYFLLFLGIVITCFFCLRVKWRAGVLLLASYVFCGFVSMKALTALLVFSVLTWGSGIILEELRDSKKKNEKEQKIFLAAAVVLYLGVLLGYKYIPYAALRFGAAETSENSFWANIAVPVGLSFYVFQAVSYLIDIHRNKTDAERKFVYLGLYMNFFAKLISGPIERKEDFVSQLRDLKKVRFLDTGRWSVAVSYMLWGYFLKMAVADRLAMITDKIFEAPGNFDSAWLLMCAFFYAMQIYCDFAGYSYIAVGCARVFGIRLTNNFNCPYMAGNISDFWRRWHISLSSWFRDYLYIPLGGNRKGVFRKNLNIMIVFILCGIWHGTGINFIIWGGLHGLYHVIHYFWTSYVKKYLPQIKGTAVLGRLVTFSAVAFAWIFFQASGTNSALQFIGKMFTLGLMPDQYTLWMEEIGIAGLEFTISWIGIGIVLLLDWLCSSKKEHFPELLQHRGSGARYLIFIVMLMVIMIFGIYGPGYQVDDFIYMQF